MPAINAAAFLLLGLSLLSLPLSASEPAMKERPARQSSRDVKVPRALVAQIEKEYRQFLAQNDVPVKEGLRRRLMNVNVELTQRKPIALHEDVRVVTPLGGGVVDLAEFVTPLRGAFKVRIKPLDDKSEPIDNVRVFFVSRTPARRIDRDDFGAGCGKYMEISKYYNETMQGAGSEVFTADQRYLSVLGGTFVIVAFEKEELQVGSVSFTDSRYPERFCE